VSGGADSLALLVLARAAGCVVTAVHVDHGLRAGTASEAEVVRDAATRYGASFRLVQLAVPPGPNVEARAREARYAALPPDVLTGHTLDDRAETMLLNLLRGAGPDGMAARLEHGARRPLLALRRSETRALCEAEGLEPVDDPSNADVRFVRNRIRAEVLPLLDDVAGRDVAPLLVRQARAFADDADLLDELAAALDPTDARALAAAPVALARRSVRAWLRAAGEGLPPDAASVERVLAVARGEVVATEIVGGGRVARRQGRLRIEPAR
jgi:tRNA(Ile)-lysidine synthase